MKKYLLLVIAVVQGSSIQSAETPWPQRPQMGVSQLKNAIQYAQNELNDPKCQPWARAEIEPHLASLKKQLQIAELQSGPQSKAVGKKVRDLEKQLQIMQLQNEISYAQNELSDPKCQPWARAQIEPHLASLKKQLQIVQNTV